MSGIWEAYALKYARVDARLRVNNFINADDHSAPMPIEFFVWLLRETDTGRCILVDCGYDEAEGARRDRPIDRHPAAALAALGVTPEDVGDLIVTHLHHDHAGTLDAWPNATFHLQAAEMEYATGPCMCHAAIRAPFTAEHVCDMVRHVYSGRVVFHRGAGEVAEGVEVHRVGGHSRGLMAVRVRTREGWMCLASDAAHFYENWLLEKPFVLVVDMEDMLDGFRMLNRLADRPSLVIPGHDPIVRSIYPEVAGGFAYRLDVAVEGFDPLRTAAPAA